MSSGRRLYLGRLAPDATRKDIEDFFPSSKYGPMVDVRIMNGFGFVEFESSKDADNAITDKNGEKLLGESLILEVAKDARRRDMYDGDRGGGFDRRGPPMGMGGGFRAPPRAGRGRVIVKGINSGMSWQDLKDFGREGGPVSFADVDRENPGQGIIEFPSLADAEDAIKKLDGLTIRGSVVTVVLDAGDAAGGGGGGGYGGGGDSGYRPRDDRDYYRRDDRDDRRGDDRDYRRDDRRGDDRDYRRDDRRGGDDRRYDDRRGGDDRRDDYRRPRDDDRPARDDDRRRERSPEPRRRSRSPAPAAPAPAAGGGSGWD